MIKRLHIFIGIAIVVTFLLTGQFMHHNYNHLKDMELMNRALFRAGHLYILLFGLINVALGSYYKLHEKKAIKTIQLIGSAVIFVASFLVIYSFFTELPSPDIERPMARMSMYLILFGVSVHGLLSLFFPTKK